MLVKPSIVKPGATVVAGTSPPPNSASRVVCQPRNRRSYSRLKLSVPCEATRVREVTADIQSRPATVIKNRQRRAVCAHSCPFERPIELLEVAARQPLPPLLGPLRKRSNGIHVIVDLIGVGEVYEAAAALLRRDAEKAVR